MSNGIELSIQPAYSIKSGKVEYAEVLVRKYKNISGPERILRYVASTNTEVEFDMLVLEETLDYLNKYPYISYPLGFNLCSRTISIEGIGSRITEKVKNSNVDASRLVIEINEDTDFKNHNTFENIKEIRSIGIQTALDDFGVSGSNIIALANNSFDILKVDKSFVDNIEAVESEHSKTKLLSIMSNICKVMGLKSIIEGVESKEQLNIIKNMEYDVVQGFIYDKPINMNEYKPHST